MALIVICLWVWILLEEQEKLEARKMLENAVEPHTSGARCVSLTHLATDLFSKFFSPFVKGCYLQPHINYLISLVRMFYDQGY